ncbi:hypothetical protein XENOCAPTIV_028808 [Xenoophorus captivus]|uniref:FH2 domain-containing protein n=1 Tax=Xenoophorus captivus TaxID=1517983 RepID=A0ABV0RME2_9TELE
MMRTEVSMSWLSTSRLPSVLSCEYTHTLTPLLSKIFPEELGWTMNPAAASCRACGEIACASENVLDFEGLENGEDGFLDKAKSWSRSIEDLHHTAAQPFCNTLVRSARQSVCKEKHRFERLMDYFRCEEGNIDFMVGQYIESDKLSVQIQAYLDNVFDVGGLLEDAETKNAALEKVEELEEHLSHVTEKLLEVENETMMKVADLETLLLQKDKDLQAIRSTNTQVNTLRRMIKEKDAAFQRQVNIERRLLELEQQGTIRLHKKPDGDISIEPLGVGGGGSAIRIKKPIKTKFRLPVFNWTALKPNQINGTVFNEIDDERVLEVNPAEETSVTFLFHKGFLKFIFIAVLLHMRYGKELDLEKFEELFKTRAQGPVVDLSCTKSKVAQKTMNVLLFDRFDLKALPVDFVECLMRFLPTEAEVKVLRQYERERRPLDQLAEEDRFMLLFSKIERLTQRMNIITFVGNFTDSIGMLTPQLNAIIAASGSVKSSPKLKRMLEVGSVSTAAFKVTFVWLRHKN